MAFVVEDGTGLVDSNSYASVEYADTYFAMRGTLDWGNLAPEVKQQKLVLATDYIDVRWGPLLKSIPLTTTQALLFPRQAWVGVPIGVKNACVEYALRASKGPLTSDPEYDESGFQKISASIKLGPIEEKNGWASGAEARAYGYWRSFPYADNLMLPFFGGMQQGRVIR